jgi:opacity protein-like surface antigen
MNRIFSSIFITGFLFAIANPAMAQGSSWYVAGGLGASFANDSDLTQGGLTLTTEFDTGAIASVAVGHTFEGLRVEGEFSYIQNDISGLKGFGVTVPASGDVSAAALMANVYYDFNADSKWRPFIGAGAGYANLSINNFSVGGITGVDDSAGVFAYQFKAGIGYAFTDSLDGTLGYRFFGTAEADLVDTGGAPFTTDGLQTHIVEAGVRYRF